jgi:hypothetical protein
MELSALLLFTPTSVVAEFGGGGEVIEISGGRRTELSLPINCQFLWYEK